MKNNLIYFLTGLVFSVGLGLGGMLDPENIKKFLWVLYPSDWSPMLLFVLMFAVVVYGIIYALQVKRGCCRIGAFKKIPQGKIDKHLVLGSIIFGIGWGLSGLCPAPAVARTALEPAQASTLVFVVLMFVGFKASAWVKK